MRRIRWTNFRFVIFFFSFPSSGKDLQEAWDRDVRYLYIYGDHI